MKAGRRVVVTGAGGFVGSSVVGALRAAGWQVVAQDRAFDADLRAAWAGGDAGPIALLEGPLDADALSAADAVIHAAAVTAAPTEAGLTPEQHVRANLDPLLDVLAWAEQAAVRRVIFLSSSAVYRATEPGPVPEGMAASPLGLYAVAKHAGEALIETLRTEHGRDVAAARLSNVYGPRERARFTRPRVSLVGQMVQAALAEGRLTVYRDDPPRDWTYAPDIGRALSSLLEAPLLAHSLYHVASEQVLNPLEIARTLQEILPGVEVETRDGTDPQAPPLTGRGYLQSDRLRREIGFAQWTPFAEGLRATVAWQQQAELAL